MQNILYPAYISIRKKPINFEAEDAKIFEHEFSRHISASYLIHKRRCFILKDIVFSGFNCYRKECLTFDLSIKALLSRLKIFTHGFQTFSHCIWVTDNLSSNYFHWFTDSLPRLINALPHTNRYKVILPLHYKNFSYIESSLKILGVAFQYYNPVLAMYVSNLLLPSHTALTGNYNERLISTLRNKFINYKTFKPMRKIYISRAKALKRKILNEAELINMLNKNAIEVHYFEDYTLEKQIELMQEASLLIGLHGAGLTNMLFMQQGGTVIELRFAEDCKNNCYFSLSSALNIDYYYTLNQKVGNDIGDANAIVDIGKLENLIKLCCFSTKKEIIW